MPRHVAEHREGPWHQPWRFSRKVHGNLHGNLHDSTHGNAHGYGHGKDHGLVHGKTYGKIHGHVCEHPRKGSRPQLGSAAGSRGKCCGCTSVETAVAIATDLCRLAVSYIIMFFKTMERTRPLTLTLALTLTHAKYQPTCPPTPSLG